MSVENPNETIQEEPAISSSDISKLEVLKTEILRDPQYIDLVPFTPEQMKFPANGVELRREHSSLPKNEGDSFENRCFSKILSKPGESIIFGPCVTDVLLNQPFTKQDIKPDALSFDISQGNIWKLTDLYEFKSARKTRQVGDKLFGFSQLLKKLRENPHYLPRLFSQAFRKLLKVHHQFEIPDDNHITVTFVYPSKGPITVKPETFFKLRYLRVPK